MNFSPATVVDAAGTVYVSNGWGSSPSTNGRVWAYDADLQNQLFEISLDRQNQGGPTLAGDGILVLADRQGLYAYRAPDVSGPYCGAAVPNSTGLAAALTARGSTDASARDLVLRVDSLPPNTFGLLVTSRTQASVPGAGGSLGTLCLAGSIGRFNDLVASSGSAGALEQRIDPGALPEGGATVPALAGQTWNFQCWYRDTDDMGMPTSDFTDAVSIEFN